MVKQIYVAPQKICFSDNFDEDKTVCASDVLFCNLFHSSILSLLTTRGGALRTE